MIASKRVSEILLFYDINLIIMEKKIKRKGKIQVMIYESINICNLAFYKYIIFIIV